jgi:hypothetical protein
MVPRQGKARHLSKATRQDTQAVDVGCHVQRLGRDEVPERGAYGVVEAHATYRESQERAAGVLAVREARSPLESVLGSLLGKSSTKATGGGTVQLEGEAKPGGR